MTSPPKQLGSDGLPGQVGGPGMVATLTAGCPAASLGDPSASLCDFLDDSGGQRVAVVLDQVAAPFLLQWGPPRLDVMPQCLAGMTNQPAVRRGASRRLTV